ncbi:MAG: ferric iron uptake transcriptional regulator [Arenicella sp.]
MSGSEELKKAGLKTTLPRLRILSMFEEDPDQHLSAEDVYKRFMDSGDDIGLATIYRVLTQFESADLVIRHNFEGGRSVFELNDGEHHDHMVCLKCGKVTEFVDPEIEERQKIVAEKHDFHLQEHSLYLYGLCKDCH